MKIALYIEDGLEQIVLTPETDTEKAILAKIHDGSRQMQLQKGSFFECKGGWMRHATASYGLDAWGRQKEENDESTMIILRPQKDKEAADEVGDGCGVSVASEPPQTTPYPEAKP